MNYYLEAFKKYAVFEGRSTRSEYWYFVLFNLVISLILLGVSILLNNDSNVLGSLYSLVAFIPGIAVAVRRLHDINKSAKMLWILIIPGVGVIWFIILMAKKSSIDENKYDLNLKEEKEL